MLLLDNFSHADLHPGNIMVRFYHPTSKTILQNLLKRTLSRFDPDYVAEVQSEVDRTDDDKLIDKVLKHADSKEDWLGEIQKLENHGYLPELVFIDAGLVSELSPQNMRNFLDLFTALTSFDGVRAGELMVERCRSPDLVVDKDGFAKRIGNIVSNVKSGRFSLSNLRVGDILGEVLVSVREHHVKMEPDFVNTVLSILILEGIGRKLDPNLDVRSLADAMLTAALPLCSTGAALAWAQSIVRRAHDGDRCSAGRYDALRADDQDLGVPRGALHRPCDCWLHADDGRFRAVRLALRLSVQRAGLCANQYST